MLPEPRLIVVQLCTSDSGVVLGILAGLHGRERILKGAIEDPVRLVDMFQGLDLLVRHSDPGPNNTVGLAAAGLPPPTTPRMDCE